MGVKRKSSVKKSEPKKPNMLQEVSPRQQKAEITKKMKIMWESLRRKSLSKGERHKLIDKIVNLKNMKEYILCSTASRVLQTVIKHGTSHQRLLLFDVLKERISDMLTSKYGKHILLKFLKYGGKGEREAVFRFMSGGLLRLIRHKEGGVVVEEFYAEVASKQQRRQMLAEFYGNHYMLNKESPNEEFVHFVGRVGSKERDAAVESVINNILPLIDRSCLQSSLVHRLIRDVASCGEWGGLKEALCERVVHLLHTADGSWVAVRCVREGSAEEHAVVLGQVKSFVWRAVVDNWGHLVMVALLSWIEDWGMLAGVIRELEESLGGMFEEKYAFRVISFILSPNDDRLVPASVRAVYSPWVEERCGRLMGVFRGRMLEYVEAHVEEMSLRKDRLWFMVVLLTGDGDRRGIFDKLTKMAVGGTALVEHPTGHLLLKHLMKDVEFVHMLVERLSGAVLGEWIGCNRGCFVVVSLLGVQGVAPHLVEMIRPYFERIGKIDCPGGKVLARCIADFSIE